MIKAILFDIDNTLLDFRKCARGAIKQSLKNFGHEYKEEYFPVFLKYNEKFWRMLEDNLITREELYQRRFKEIFKELNINIDGALFEQDFIKNLYKSHEPVANTYEILDYLSKKYDLYIASNSSYDEQTGRLKLAGMLDYFKKVYTSEEIGAAKPNKEFFDYIYKDLKDLNKDEILVIGDSAYADIKGGKDFGFKTCQFDSYNQPESDADYKITNLLSLKEFL